MNMKNLVLIILAVAGVVLVGLMTRTFLNGAQSNAQATQAKPAQAPSTQILVAKKDISIGTILKEEDLVWQAWPKKGLNKAYYPKKTTKKKTLTGKVARYPFAAGEPFTKSALVSQGERGYLAAILTPGMRAVSVPISVTSGVAGFVSPGDRVDVILTHTIEPVRREKYRIAETIFQNVRVLATDQKSQADNKAKVAKSATLEVTAQMAERLAIVSNLGKVSLSLRSLVVGEDGLLHDPETPPVAHTVSHSLDSDISRFLPKMKKKKNKGLVRIRRGSTLSTVKHRTNEAPSNGAPDTPQSDDEGADR